MPGFYASPGGTVPATFIPVQRRIFTFDNGSGGKDVQHFNTTLNAACGFHVVQRSGNRIDQPVAGSKRDVDRGTRAGSYVSITGGSTATINGKSVSVSFNCQAPVAAGQFTVPAPVLLSLPAGSGSLERWRLHQHTVVYGSGP